MAGRPPLLPAIWGSGQRDRFMSLMRDAIGVLSWRAGRVNGSGRSRATAAEASGSLRRRLPNYRCYTFQLHQQRSPPRLRFLMTQYRRLSSLNRHTRQGWSQLLGLGEFIEVLPPQMRVSTNWYLGTADAVYQNIYSIGSEHSRYVIVLFRRPYVT